MDGTWKLILSMGLVESNPQNKLYDDEFNKPGYGTEVKPLVKEDRNFSKLSIDRGHLEAFVHYISDEGITVSDGERPPVEKTGLQKLVESQRTQGASINKILVWNPFHSLLSDSKDLGYTIGRFIAIHGKSKAGMVFNYGYYISVWEKHLAGEWKFVFDGGNRVSMDGEEQVLFLNRVLGFFK